MAKRNIGLGHPDHGRGGKSGHQTSETHTRNVTIGKVNERIMRAHAKAERKQERNIAELTSHIQLELIPKVNALSQRLREDLSRRRGTVNTNILKVLALNKWYIDEIEKYMLQKKIILEKLTSGERQQISLIAEGDHVRYLTTLLGENPSALRTRDVDEQLTKWVGRVPGMLQGRY